VGDSRFAQGRMTKNFSKQKRYSINILEQKAYEPVQTRSTVMML